VSDRFAGKRGLVLGVANRRSIAWAIAQELAAGGAELAFTYQGERIEKGVRELADSVSAPLVTECDVRSDEGLERVFSEVGETFGGELDLVVHSVAFADARDLEGRFTDTPRDRFWLALDVSAYSLVACARLAEPLMEAAGGGSIMTMTYLGGERAVPHYNVMGVAIVEERSPLHRPIEAGDVGAAGAFLLSDEARNITGTTLYVDSGYHAMGM
jgi:enoyl-[acyl-carrier protein] reductase I